MQGQPTNKSSYIRAKNQEHPYGHILIIDDDEEILNVLSHFLVREGHIISTFSSTHSALDILQDSSRPVQLILSDLKMPGIDGITLIDKLKEFSIDIPIVLMTAYASIETAIEAMRKGAFDYITKPLNLSEISIIVKRALKFSRLERNYQQLTQNLQQQRGLEGMIGKSCKMQQIFQFIQKVASTTANILISGESGTGKELIARAIHNLGPRAHRPFIPINCSAIPDTLLESELFGHIKGAYTGADDNRKGLFLEASSGTIFLDEIGDMPIKLQAKLLRVLQERKIRPVGSNFLQEVDVRILAASHKNLREEIAMGHFREDLYYRLSVIPIEVPSLRERPEDIPLLADYFLKKYNAANNFDIQGFSASAMNILLDQKWEGNVRELENTIERAVILCHSNLIKPEDLLLSTDHHSKGQESGSEIFKKLPPLKDIEAQYIRYVLDKTQNQKEKSASILGISRKTLYRKEKELFH